MKEMNQWVQEMLNAPERVAIPIMTHPGIELCHYSVKEAVTDGQKQAEAILKLSEVYPAAASTVIMDLTVEAEAFGSSIVFPEEEVPSVVGRLVFDEKSVQALQVPSLTAGRVPECLKANRLSAASLTDKPIWGGCIGPFSLAGRLFGLSELMMALYMEPQVIECLLNKCTDFLISYCVAIKETGIDGIVIAEPAAGLISNDDCIRYSTQYIRSIIDAVQDDTFLVVLHNCGNAGHCTDAMTKSGAKGLHFGNKINMPEALAHCPADVLVLGNLDPVGVLKQMEADEVYKATSDLLNQTAAFSNFILSTGCDVPPGVAPENIQAFYQALNDYNQSINKEKQ